MIERIREDTLNLMTIAGLSGHEDQVRNYIKEELKKSVSNQFLINLVTLQSPLQAQVPV